jgi:hypothetical protein
MTFETDEIKTSREFSLAQLLFNPFIRIAGVEALAFGTVFILLTSAIASIAPAHFDGVLDFHVGRAGAVPTWFFFLEGLIDWFSLTVLLLVVGKLFSSSKVRSIDVMGTQALARAPYILAALVALMPGFGRYSQYLLWQATHMGTYVLPLAFDGTVFVIGSIVALVALVWSIVLMYRAFSTSCNMKGWSARIIFIIALIAAEILSKVLIIKAASATL